MIRLQLTDDDLENIAEALDDPEVSERGKKKLLVITMHQQGAQHSFIASCLRLSAPTLIAYLKEYRDGGLPTVLEDRYYRPSSALDPFWQCLICSFQTAPVANAKAAVVRIETLTGIRLSASQCRRVMKKMGMSLKKSAPIPGKADGQLLSNPAPTKAGRGSRGPAQSFLCRCRTLCPGCLSGSGLVFHPALDQDGFRTAARQRPRCDRQP